MAVITIKGVTTGDTLQSPLALTPALADLGPVDQSPPLLPAGEAHYFAPITIVDNSPISEPAAGVITLFQQPTFFQDYYYRVHIRPVRIDLGVVAAAQTRTARLWNAYPDQSISLGAITFSQAGVEYVGDDPPYEILPLLLKTWDLVVTTSGPPDINAEVQFDFDDVPDPPPILITGTRAIQFRFQPEVPVRESWRYLTDVKISVDGTEQRAGLRGVPRVSQDTSIIIDTADDIRELQSMLFSATNRFWVPQYQYATQITAEALAGSSYLQLNTTLADVRPNEYLMLLIGAGTLLVQVSSIAVGGVNLAAPLATTIPRGTVAAPGSPSFINDNTSLSRYAVHEVADIDVHADFTTVRLVFPRPGHAQVLTTFDGMVVLDKQPLANDKLPEPYTANTTKYDAQVGVTELISLWDVTKVGGTRDYLVKRVSNPEQLDYWKLFADSLRGSLKNFLLPSFRPDLTLYVPLGMGANNATFTGSAYADFYFKSLAHRYLAITSAMGVHYAKVSSVSKTVEGNSLVVFSPALPAIAGWEAATMVSMMPACRVLNDEFQLTHLASESYFSFSFRTAYP